MASNIFRELKGVEEARQEMMSRIRPLEATEELSLRPAWGRVLARDLISPENLPNFNRAAMDGYALHARETTGASPVSPVYLQDFLPVRTGAAVPEDYDAVVMMEDTVPRGDLLEVCAALHPHKNLGLVGEDVLMGDTVLKEGHKLRPPDLALAAALGLESLTVYRKPRVLIVPTGSELIPLGSGRPKAGQAREIVSLMASLYAEMWGGCPRITEIVPDDSHLISQVFQDLRDADMIILTGGTSVGDRDYSSSCIRSAGEVLAHGLRLTPGKPTAVGMVKGVPVVCLPGYPVAALVALFLLVRPGLQKMARLPERLPTVRARLEGNIVSRPGYTTAARVRLKNLSAYPIMTSGAGILSSVTRAQGLVMVPEEMEGLKEGELVDVVLLE